MLERALTVGSTTIGVLRPIHEKTCWAFDRLLESLQTGDQAAAREVAESKAAVNKLADEATAHLARRLVADEPNRLAALQIQTDIIENLKRLNTLTRRLDTSARQLVIALVTGPYLTRVSTSAGFDWKETIEIRALEQIR